MGSLEQKARGTIRNRITRCRREFTFGKQSSRASRQLYRCIQTASRREQWLKTLLSKCSFNLREAGPRLLKGAFLAGGPGQRIEERGRKELEKYLLCKPQAATAFPFSYVLNVTRAKGNVMPPIPARGHVTVTTFLGFKKLILTLQRDTENPAGFGFCILHGVIGRDYFLAGLFSCGLSCAVILFGQWEEKWKLVVLLFRGRVCIWES